MLYSKAMSNHSERAEIHSLYDLKKKVAEKSRKQYGDKKKSKGNNEGNYEGINTPNNYYYEQYKNRLNGSKHSKIGSTMLGDDQFNHISPWYDKNMTLVSERKRMEFGNYLSSQSKGQSK